MVDKIIALRCVSQSLHGHIFAAAAVASTTAGETRTWQSRCPTDGSVHPTVAQQIPALNMPINCGFKFQVWESWRRFFDPLRQDGYSTVVVCDGWPVESRFLWSGHWLDEFSGPRILDVATMLDWIGVDASKLDDWLDQQGCPPIDGAAVNPLRSARRITQAYRMMTARPAPHADDPVGGSDLPTPARQKIIRWSARQSA